MGYSEAISWLRHGMESKLEKVICICSGTDRTGTNQYGSTKPANLRRKLMTTQLRQQ